MGDRLATLFECSQYNFQVLKYLNILQCIHRGRISQFYINIYFLEIRLSQKLRLFVVRSLVFVVVVVVVDDDTYYSVYLSSNIIQTV